MAVSFTQARTDDMAQRLLYKIAVSLGASGPRLDDTAQRLTWKIVSVLWTAGSNSRFAPRLDDTWQRLLWKWASLLFVSHGGNAGQQPRLDDTAQRLLVKIASLMGLPCTCAPSEAQRLLYDIATALQHGVSPAPAPIPCALPAAPGDLGASAGNGQVTLTWPAGVGATGYKVYRSPSPGAGPWTLAGTSVAASFVDNAVVNGTTYYYQVSSTNACGESAVGIVESHATPVVPPASFVVTTTGADTLTIAELTVSAAMIVDWGDGNTDSFLGAGARTHNYAGAGAWTVKFLSPLLVTVLQLSDSKITLNSIDIAMCVNITTFKAGNLKAGTFNSSDVSAWRPTDFELYSPANGYLGAFNSSDVIAWRPTKIYISGLPTSYSVIFNSSDVSAWTPTLFYLNSIQMLAATMSVGGLAGWTSATYIDFSFNRLNQAKVDQVLADAYTAFATRSVSGGVIDLSGGGNVAPSGIFQSQTPPTSGKETAFDLLNDPTSINPTKKWSTITTN